MAFNASPRMIATIETSKLLKDVIFMRIPSIGTMREAEIWADSIAHEIYDGYATSDYKIAYALAFMLDFIPQFIVHIKSENTSLYRV
jgi:hypothetical protein